jgi:hypothetical protein
VLLARPGAASPAAAPSGPSQSGRALPDLHGVGPEGTAG